MPNPVFQLTARSLSKVVSGRAAETMLSASLRDLKLSPDTVTARDMQRVLAGPLERRLSQVLPGTAAFDKLRALSRRLERNDLKSSTMFGQDDRTVIWDQEDDTIWNDESHLQGPEEGPDRAPPTAARRPPPSPAPLDARFKATPPVPEAGRKEESVTDLSAPQSAAESLKSDLKDEAFAASAEESSAEAFGADDFEFSDPDYAHLQAAHKRYELATPQGQDALLYELARHAGVQTVVLCSTDGQVLSVRAPQGAPQLGSVVAATAMLFRQRDLKLLSADLGNATVCMRVVGNYCVALLARGNVNVGRLLSELQQIEVAA
ncbi:roadblock/LC7 domain-containing protein [Deinococcus alpinitundrae]|uniref:roadblock/LC7 domain-containing protein n=1 Tax=Deinococcus alpinitundrae TaxID=468913 RepID=UPI00137AAB45|nr:roadblock/LC7 domain-containing protein [Deinococcus alpinitundrae]